MKRKLTLFVLLLCVITYSSNTIQAQWSVVDTADFLSTAGSAVYTSTALDSNNNPYVAFRDGDNGNKATVMKHDGNSWVAVGSPGFSAGQANYLSLAIDGNNNPYVAYNDVTNGNKATVMKYNGSSWVALGGAGFTSSVAIYTSLVFDSNDTAYIAFRDGSNFSRGTVMKYNGSSWSVVGTAGFTAGGADFITLALDANDNPVVAYRDGANGNYASVMKYNGGSWTQLGTAGFSTGIAQYLSLAFDSNDTAYVSYQDYGNSQKATVMKFNGSAWVAAGGAGFSANQALYSSLVFDSNDTLYIAYRDAGNSYRATVMKYNGSSWTVVGTVGFSAGTSNFLSLVFDSSDKPYVGYVDADNGNKATVMKYDGSGWSVVGLRKISTGTAYYTSIALDTNNIPYVVFRDVDNSNKATVRKFNGTSWETVGTAGFSAGQADYTSLAIDGNNNPYVIYKDGGNGNKATVMKFNGSSWVAVGSAGFTASIAEYTDITFDSNDTAYVAFRDFSNIGKATVMKFNGSSWVTVGSAGFSAGTSLELSLALDHNDNPTVVYRDVTNSNKATVMKYSGSSWGVVGTVGFSASNATYLSLAFDSNDTAYVSYSDFSVSNKATVMKFNGSTWVAAGGAGFSAGQAYYTSLAFDTNDSLYIAYRDGGNSYRATVMKYNGSTWTALGDPGFSAGTSNYLSFAFDSNNNPYVAFTESNNAIVMKYEMLNIWNGSTWSGGAPDSTQTVAIASATAPTTFSCNNLTIRNGYELNTGTNDIVSIYGDLTNNGNGVTGTGKVSFTKDGTSNIYGGIVAHQGTITVENGCTLNTNNKLRLTSNATNTGRIGEGAGTIIGNVMAQRYSIGKRRYRLYAHPFSTSIALSQLTDEIDITGTGGTANGFSATTSNAASAFWFDATAADTTTNSVNSGWTAFTSTNGTGANSWDRHELLLLYLRGAKGEGLTGASYTPSASTFEAAGTVNQGTQVVTLTKGTNTNFAAVGNPFPSGVQMQNITPGASVGANYYAFDASVGADGAYVTNAFTLSYILPAYAGFFTTISATTDITFEEADKEAGGAALFKTTAPANWVELLISDSTIKWDRLLINLDANAMDVEDKQDAKKLYNPNLDFYTLSKDGARLAVDVRPYNDGASIPLGLTAYNRYNKYAIKTGMFDIPVGAKLVLHDKYLNKTEELKTGAEYWFDVTADTLSQGNQRFEINMLGKPTTGIIEATSNKPKMQLIPNPAYNEVKVSFDKLVGKAQLKLMSVTGQVVYQTTTTTQTGSLMIPLQNLPAGIYIVELQSSNARFTEKLIKE